MQSITAIKISPCRLRKDVIYKNESLIHNKIIRSTANSENSTNENQIVHNPNYSHIYGHFYKNFIASDFGRGKCIT